MNSFQPIAGQIDFPTAAAFYIGVNTDQKRIIVSFRGSQSVRSVIVDVMFALVPAKNVNPSFKGHLHSGFSFTYLILRQRVTSNLLALDFSSQTYRVGVISFGLGLRFGTR